MKYLIFLPITLLSFGVAFGGEGLIQSTEGREALLAEADSSAGEVGGWYNDCDKYTDECDVTSTNKSVVTPEDSGDDDIDGLRSSEADSGDVRPRYR